MGFEFSVLRLIFPKHRRGENENANQVDNNNSNHNNERGKTAAFDNKFSFMFFFCD